ncbi:MAG: SDR family NAD(P)-dependent oxidoreductase [Smithella sp.]|jgi:NAD(P)-dependent dehydrogenase (short-subunit alcohol dehydrogenase family)
MKNLRGKTVLITGSGGGIGRALAMEFALQGCSLVLCDINSDAVNETARKLIETGTDTLAFITDVSKEDEVRSLSEKLKAADVKVDIIVCNAGIGWTGPTYLMDRADWERVMGVNFYGVVHFIRHFVPAMTGRKDGHVVIISSIFGITGLPYGTLYASSKAALVALGECLRAELSFHDIGVTTICPGLIETGLISSTFFKGVDEKARELPARIRTMPADKCARVIVKSVRKNRGIVVITGLAKSIWIVKRLSQRMFEYMQTRIAGETNDYING